MTSMPRLVWTNIPSNIGGPFGIGAKNDRGGRLLQFATAENLSIANTFFEKREKRYWTWESPSKEVKNQIDFILTSQRGILRNCEIISHVDIGSDHRMLRGKIMLSERSARLRSIRSPKAMRVDMCLLESNKMEYQLELRNRFATLMILRTSVIILRRHCWKPPMKLPREDTM